MLFNEQGFIDIDEMIAQALAEQAIAGGTSSSASASSFASTSKFCTSCGTKTDGTSKFCPECGAKLG